MDDRRFDALAKQLAASTNRRGFVRRLLGLGSAAAVGTRLAGEKAEAAPRPSPTPAPLRCPGVQIPVNGKCVCPADKGVQCGSACCPPGAATCCDGACCSGECYGEELCCPTGRHYCAATNECCRDGQKCCPGFGCYRPDRQCCTDAECAPFSGICTPSTCGPDHVCVSTYDCRRNEACCDVNGECFTHPCNPDGSCGPSVMDCRLGRESVCCPNGGKCQADGSCCWPTKTTCTTGECGQIPDGCGGTIDCGSCAEGSICLASHVCCQPRPPCSSNSCGVIPDGCGGTLDCGSCPDGDICRSNHTCCTLNVCAANQCGELPNFCGGTIDCGECPSGHFCQDNHTCCQPIPCTDRCGTIYDGCGGSITCEDTCPPGTTCQQTVCVANP